MVRGPRGWGLEGDKMRGGKADKVPGRRCLTERTKRDIGSWLERGQREGGRWEFLRQTVSCKEQVSKLLKLIGQG